MFLRLLGNLGEDLGKMPISAQDSNSERTLKIRIEFESINIEAGSGLNVGSWVFVVFVLKTCTNPAVFGEGLWDGDEEVMDEIRSKDIHVLPIKMGPWSKGAKGIIEDHNLRRVHKRAF